MKWTLTLLLALSALAQDLERGKVISKIAASNDYSYALYLPSAYGPNRSWPAVFMFDPVARGPVAIEAARAAAEARGIILIASNESRNGSFKNSLEAGNAMWKDAHARLNIDRKRSYTAGFSGGARVAILFAHLCPDCVSAVIANGAGFPVQLPPAKEDHFAVFATTGDLDPNYREIVGLRRPLDRVGIAHRAFIFHGPHDWAPTAGWEQAFDWIALVEMKKGVRPKDPIFVDKTYLTLRAYAETLRSEGDLANAGRAYEQMLTDLAGLRDTADAAQQLEAIRADKIYRQQVKEEERAFADENATANDGLRQMQAIVGRTAPPPLAGDQPQAQTPMDHHEALQQLRGKMSSLRKKIDATPDGAPAKIALRRQLGILFMLGFETTGSLLGHKKYEPALEILTAIADFAKSAPGAHLGKARALAALGKQKEALLAAKLARAGGLPAEALRVPELEPLLDKPEWRTLLTP